MAARAHLLALFAALACACASTARRIGTPMPGDPTWPRDGQKRIAYVGELHAPENLGIEHGFFGRVWRWIAGADDSEELYRPFAVAVAPDGRVAVADPGRRSVHLYDPRAGDYRRLTAKLAYPVAVAFAGNTLFVADGERRELSAFDARGERIPLPVAVPELQRPAGLAVDERRRLLFVSDSPSHVVHALPLDGGEGRRLGGRGDAAGQLNFPTHLAVDGAGQLY
ncbi:MAG TPA: hypothetical protein VE964_14545, partial [Myxococcales bacterium]|nr:hypothetical protein [Myxococcales bacterium]